MNHPKETPPHPLFPKYGLKPTTINHYLQGVGHASFSLFLKTDSTNDNKWKLITCFKRRKRTKRRWSSVSMLNRDNNENVGARRGFHPQ